MNKKDPTRIADIALSKAPISKLQIVAMVCSIVIFSFGNRVFNLIPFYLYYPAIVCRLSDGQQFACDRIRACQPDIQSYYFNYTDPNTLINFMTQLNLVCYEPYYIGLLGTVSFISFAVGSFFFTKQADIYGRHKVVCIAATITPIGLAAIIIGAKKLGIFFLYFVFGFMGLSYNPRGSTSYLYALEVIPNEARLLFGTLLFFFDGCFSVFTAVYFFYWKSQNLYLIVLGAVFTFALIVMKFFLPETPAFLLMKGNISGYQASIDKITGHKRELLDSLNISNVTEWRKEQMNKPKTTFTSLWRNKSLRSNLIAVILLNSTCAFNNILVGFYTKYFPGSFFFNYAVLGIADSITLLYVQLLSRSLKRLIHIINFCLVIAVVWSAAFLGLQSLYPAVVPIGILFLRLHLAALQNFGNHINQMLFPAEYRSLASGTMNFICRGCTALAVLIVEYTSNPVLIVLVLSAALIFSLSGLITEPSLVEEKKETV